MEELINDGKITLIEDGEEKEYTVLFTFHSDKYKKDYFVYTDDQEDEDGYLNVFASSYNQDTGELEAVEAEEEWTNIDQMVFRVVGEVKNKEEQ